MSQETVMAPVVDYAKPYKGNPAQPMTPPDCWGVVASSKPHPAIAPKDKMPLPVLKYVTFILASDKSTNGTQLISTQLTSSALKMTQT